MVVVGVDGVMMGTIFSFWGQYYVSLGSYGSLHKCH
jgi:hypothetical protein